MIGAFLLATAPLATAIDAETAFARDARRIGQWTAFRKWSDRDAVMFAPRAVWAKRFLGPLKDPPNAISWRASLSLVSCDGRTAVNTGPWFKQDGSVGGSFTTVWQRTPGGWRWAYDGGGPDRHEPSRRSPVTHQASCAGRATGAPIAPPPRSASNGGSNPTDEGRGQSADKTLGWDWKVTSNGARRFRVYQWNGSRYTEVLHSEVPGAS